MKEDIKISKDTCKDVINYLTMVLKTRGVVC